MRGFVSIKALFLSALLWSLCVYAQGDKIVIKKDVEDRVKVAILDASQSPTTSAWSIFVDDMTISGHFLPHKRYERGEFDLRKVPPHLSGMEYLLLYRLDRSLQGATLDIKLVQSGSGKVLLEKSYRAVHGSKYLFLIHKAVSDINDHLGYEPIEWINRYVVYAKYTSRGKSEIVIADYTLHYKKTLISGSKALFPIWADEEQEHLIYSNFDRLKPTIYTFNIYTGTKSIVASSQGMAVCSDVDEQSGTKVLTLAPNGQPDIYLKKEGALQRQTRYSGIDVGGKLLNNETLVFISDRLGKPKIFKKRIGSAAVVPIVFHGLSHNSVDAYKDKIVYSTRERDKKRFNVYLKDIKSGETVPLSMSGKNLFPRFAKGGDVVMFIKHTPHGSKIVYVNVKSKSRVSFQLRDKKIQSINW